MKKASGFVIPFRLSNRNYKIQKHKDVKLGAETKSISSTPQINKVGYKHRNTAINSSVTKLLNFENESILFSGVGVMQQYCVKGSDVILRHVSYIRSDKSNDLQITVNNLKPQTSSYTIVLAKDICSFNFKDKCAFLVKVIDSQDHLKSMTFKTDSFKEKSLWLRTYGVNMTSAQQLLDICIQEVEQRRFHLGLKKRGEDRNIILINANTLLTVLNSLKKANGIDLTNAAQWSIKGLEKLMQLLLNEISGPLIPYENQKSLRDPECSKFNAPNETRKLLNTLPNQNRTMLYALVTHMERLSKYYFMVLSSTNKDLPCIRQNMCQRLVPTIFRLQDEISNDLIMNKARDLLYHTMLCITGCI